ncbi:hypothetical protein CFR74_00950 [Novacetimonas hansenii]|nr:hypothetical protein CFR74_00950 [Novacetimonas hansenii]
MQGPDRFHIDRSGRKVMGFSDITQIAEEKRKKDDVAIKPPVRSPFSGDIPPLLRQISGKKDQRQRQTLFRK